jgi:predicted ATPase
MDRRTLYAEALSALLKGEMAHLALARNFELLAEVARLAREDAPVALATSDPALYTSWRAAVTRYHVSGWTYMTPERIAEVTGSDGEAPKAPAVPGSPAGEDDTA